jgi:D-beta-D-heptose 7-phosphate kinase/D-beta-D-heptose 1-phosphate adenosyltransferase
MVFRHDWDATIKPTAPLFLPRDCRALIVSDYLKGWVQPDQSQALIGQARNRDLPVVVDPKGLNWARYSGATAITPNRSEWEAWLFTDQILPEVGAVLMKDGANGICVTKHGRDAGQVQVPTPARPVYDVTGAGDTVTAVVALTLAAGGDYVQAARLSNLAAGEVVGIIGTATCSQARLLELCHGL